MISIPDQLKAFQFYLVRSGAKIPLEKAWNDTRNYTHDHYILQNHLWTRNNYGVVCGINQLIVLDFDHDEFYADAQKYLPETFTVLSARKRLPHLYYVLDGEMFARTTVRAKDGTTLMDIQAARSGVIGPGSMVDGRTYDIIRDIPLQTISLEFITSLFQLRTSRVYSGPRIEDNPEAILRTRTALERLGLEPQRNGNFKCPFHPMHGFGNLNVFAEGYIHCFHCQRTWFDLEQFIINFCEQGGLRA